MDKKSLTLPRNQNLMGDSNEDGGRPKVASRPVSFYDNFREIAANNAELRNSDELPTMAHCLNTTVPQKIVTKNVAERHTPTRNSLRHSRMIVLNRSGSVPKRSLPPVLRFHKLASALVGLHTIVGAAISCLSLWFIIWAPNIRRRDNPYWSGLPLLLSGIIGLFLLCCFRKEYPGMPKAWFVYVVKIISVSLSTIAGAACLTASVFALIHLIALSGMSCSPANQLNATCVCTRNGTQPVKSYHYVDLNCPEVDNVLKFLLIFSCASNAIGGIISLWYVYLHWASRYTYVYSKVRTKEKRPIVISNK